MPLSIFSHYRRRYTPILLLFCMSSFACAHVTDQFNAIKTDPNALYAFFKEMPKGGELHYHLSGGVYAETMLALAAFGNYAIDPDTLSISESKEPLNNQSAALYNKTIRAWSMKDFIPGQESGHDHFFATFSKFHALESNIQAQLLADIMQRAANQHELYLEIMVSPDNTRSTTFSPLIHNVTSFADKQRSLLADKGFQNNLTYTLSKTTRLLKDARQVLDCTSHPQQPVCELTVKLQYFVLREQPLDLVFAQALNGFVAAAQSSDIVAINLVQAEDGKISLRDYQAQMHIFKLLHAAYPTVHIALHAGELTPQTSPPDSLRFHIHDAIMTGHAERIGHGVDIAQEDNATSLLKHMATTPVAVEINLTSNREILRVSGKDHPLNYYLKHHVPVVLSTDDEGILRTDLTQQYVDAVIEHKLDYSTIKTLNRNALTYSFLPGKSLWTDAEKGIVVPECLNLSSTSCERFIKHNTKARLQWNLEKKLKTFEQSYDNVVS